MKWVVFATFLAGNFCLTIHEAYPTVKIRNREIRQAARKWLDEVFKDSEKEKLFNRLVNLEHTLVVNDETFKIIDESPFCWLILAFKSSESAHNPCKN